METNTTPHRSAISSLTEILEKSPFTDDTIVGLSADGKSIIKAGEQTPENSNKSLSALRFHLLRLKKPYEKNLHKRDRDIIVPTVNTLKNAKLIAQKIETSDDIIDLETQSFRSSIEEKALSKKLDLFDKKVEIWMPLDCAESLPQTRRVLLPTPKHFLHLPHDSRMQPLSVRSRFLGGRRVTRHPLPQHTSRPEIPTGGEPGTFTDTVINTFQIYENLPVEGHYLGDNARTMTRFLTNIPALFPEEHLKPEVISRARIQAKRLCQSLFVDWHHGVAGGFFYRKQIEDLPESKYKKMLMDEMENAKDEFERT